MACRSYRPWEMASLHLMSTSESCHLRYGLHWGNQHGFGHELAKGSSQNVVGRLDLLVGVVGDQGVYAWHNNLLPSRLWASCHRTSCRLAAPRGRSAARCHSA